VEFDSNNNIVFSGYTGSSDFPLVNQLYNDSLGYDAFFAKIAPDGESLLFSSYLGGDFEDRSYAMDVLSDDTLLITSPASSSNMPVQNEFMTHSGASDGYIALIDSQGSELLFGSYYGGSSNDYVLGMSVDGEDKIAVIGYTQSDDLPTINAIQDSFAGFTDTMVWVFGYEESTSVDPPIVLIATVGIAIFALALVVGLKRR
jgi:Tol biopolymer transport system component